MSETSEYPEDENPRPSFWPARLPTIPPRSSLRSRINRPNAPPALTRNFSTPRRDADLEYYFDETIHTPTTATTISSSSSLRCLTPSTTPASAPSCHTTFASADPSFHKWLAATVGHQRYINSRRFAAATMSSTEGDLPSPPVPAKDYTDGAGQGREQAHARSDSTFDYTDYLHQTATLAPPPSSLSLCNSSGWSCVARRTARSP
jgi:hypothetical protein